MGAICIGISGWRYEPWRGVFYPPGLAQARELEYASRFLPTVEINGSFYALPRKYGVALVVADTAGKWPDVEEVTTDFVYIRLHGEHELYASGYEDESLERWAARIRAWAAGGDVYCYFDNDIKVRAPFDAKRLIELVNAGRGPG